MTKKKKSKRHDKKAVDELLGKKCNDKPANRKSGRKRDYAYLKPTQFKPGQSGNPLGAAVVPKHVREMRKLTRENVEKIGELVTLGDMEALEEIAEGKKGTPALLAVFAKVVLNSWRKGDMFTIDKLLDRVLGPAKKQHTDDEFDERVQVVVTLPSNGREVKE